MLAIKASLQKALEQAEKVRKPGVQAGIIVKTCTAQLKWVHEMLDAHRDMYKLAGVRVWQEAVMAAWRAAGPRAHAALPGLPAAAWAT